MPIEKGKGGRPKGAVNRSALFVRETIEAALGMSLPEKMLEKMKDLKGPEQVYYYEKLMKYCYPTLTATEITGTVTVDKKEDVSEMAAAIKEAALRK